MILGVSTYFMPYLLDPLMSMLMEAPHSHILVCVWYLLCSRFQRHSTHFIHPTGPPQTAQTPSPSAISNIEAVFLGPPVNITHHAPSATLNAHFFSQDNQHKNLDYIKLQVFNKDQTHATGTHQFLSPSIMSMVCSLNYQFVHQRFFHASHQCILYMAKLGVYTVLLKYIPKISHLCCAFIISK